MSDTVNINRDSLNNAHANLVGARYEVMKAKQAVAEGAPLAARLAAINLAVEAAIEQLKHGVMQQLGDSE